MKQIDTKQLAQLVELIGGKKNIAAVSHCVTRIRFVLEDPSLADVKAIDQLPMIKGSFTQGGQFQVVVGQDVERWFKALLDITALEGSDKEATSRVARKNLRWYELAISHLAEIFYPLLPALISGGLILGFRNVIGDIAMFGDQPLIKQYPSWQTVYDFLWLLGEAIFMYLPVGICWATMRKMGATPILGIVLGITLVSPQLMSAYLLGQQTPEMWDFGLFSIDKVGYQSQVIPSLLAAMALAFIEQRLKRWIPDFLHLVLVPVCSLLLAVFLAHTVIGPFGRLIGEGLAWAVGGIMSGSFAALGAVLFGFFYAPLVITGIHHTTLAIDLQMISTTGSTPIWPLIALSNIAQASAVLGIILVSRKKDEREISIPAAISAYLGVTEPAMYGINLKYRYPMLCAMSGSACAALFCGWFGVRAIAVGVGGLPGILSIQTQFWSIFFIAMLIAIVVPMVSTILLHKRQSQRQLLTENA